MPVRGRGRGRGRGATNTSNRGSPRTQLDVETSNQNRSTGPAVSNTPRARKSISAQHLPPQYEFTPTNSQTTNISQRSPVPFFQPLTNPGVQNYPPPLNLFPNARSHSGASDSPQHRASASPHSSAVHPRPSVAFQPRVSASNPRHSPPTSSQAQNEDEYEEDEDDEAYEEENPEDGDEAQNQFTEVEPTLPPDVLDGLHELLTQPGREDYTTLLSPHLEPGTTWFGQRKSRLTGKITKIFTNKFNKPYYSWNCVPIPKREKYFLEFAKQHTWNPLYTGAVQEKFEKICQTRMKDMVSKAGSQRKQPNWIGDKLWSVMCAHWDTEEFKGKSATTRAARLSERNGHGPHKHVSGQKSFYHVEQDLEEELGRPPTIIEVFLKTHTKKNGSFVDQRAQEIFDIYKKKKAAKLALLHNDDYADGTSPRSELSLEEDNEIFYQSSIKNDRGQQYGLGSLGHYINGKRKYPGSSSSFKSVHEQLEEANRRIEEQEAEHLRVTKALQAEVKGLGVVKRFLTVKNPEFLAFAAAESEETSSPGA